MALPSLRFALAACALLACTTTADSGDDSSDQPSVTVVNVSYEVDPVPVCGAADSIPRRVQAVAPRGERLLLVEVQKLTASLRPPGACGGLDPCGHFRVLLDGAPASGSGRVASRTFEVPLSGLPNPLGAHRLEVQFHDDFSEPAVGPDGKPIAFVIDLDVVDAGDPSCAAP